MFCACERQCREVQAPPQAHHAVHLYPDRYLSVTRGSFLASVYHELSVALVQSLGYVCPSCALLLASKQQGRQVLPGAEHPSERPSLMECSVVIVLPVYWLWHFSSPVGVFCLLWDL
jgi:hypothetical protein